MEIGLLISLSGVIAKVSKDLFDINSNLNKNKYNNYILPIWEAFKLVHNDYKNSFIKYVARVEEGKTLDELIVEIQQDAIFTQDIRQELANIIGVITEKELKNETLASFLEDISWYLFEKESGFKIKYGIVTTDLILILNGNARREILIERLLALNTYNYITEKDKENRSIIIPKDKKEIVDYMNFYFLKMQRRYGATSRDFHKLRREII